MYIGLGIVLLVGGAILSFDVITVNIPHVNADALGAILMAGGALAILLSFTMRTRYVVRHHEVEPPPVVDDRRI